MAMSVVVMNVSIRIANQSYQDVRLTTFSIQKEGSDIAVTLATWKEIQAVA